MWLTALGEKRADKVGQIILPYLSKNVRVIDIGCGEGYITEYLRSKSGEEVIGVDIAKKPEVSIPFVLYDGKTLPFKDKEFNLGLLIFVLHHANDESRLLSETQRISQKIIVMEDVYSNIAGYLFTVMMDFLLNRGGGSTTFKKIEQWEEIFSNLGLLVLEKKEFKLGIFGPSNHCLFLLKPVS